MISNLSKEFIEWIMNENDKDISKWYMLKKSSVPEKFGNSLWVILDELEDNNIVKNVRKNGQSQKQQCDFSFLPIALDYVKIDELQDKIIANEDNQDNDYEENSNTNENWFKKNISWFVPMIFGAIVAILIAVFLS